MRKVLGMAVLSCALVVAGFASPASAAGGPPTIATVSPHSVPRDGSVIVTGSGCAAASPISFLVWHTTIGPEQVEKNSTQTGWLADGTGAFTRVIDLDNAFSVGQIGIVASCTPTYEEAGASSPVDDGSYALVTAADPTVDVSVQAQAGYGSRPTVTVTTRRATGSITVELDGAVVHTAGSRAGRTSFRLPATLGLGSHELKATFDEEPLDISSVIDTATVTIVKATATLSLSRAKAKIASGKKAKLTVVLKAGAAPTTGTVKVKEGKKVLKTRALKSADHGRATVKVTLTKVGKHKLKAVFLGNAYVGRATSPKVKVKVV